MSERGPKGAEAGDASSTGERNVPWREFLALLSPHRGRFALAFVAMAVHALMTGAYAYLVGPLLAFLFTGGNTGYEAFFVFVPGMDPAGLDRHGVTLLLPAVIIGVAALKGLAWYVQTTSMARIGQRLAAKLRRRMMRRILATDTERARALGRGDAATRLGADVDAVENGLVEATAACVRDGLTLLVLLVLAVSLDWQLAVLAFVVLPVAIMPIVRFGRRLRSATRTGQQARGRLIGHVVEMLRNRESLRTRAALDAEIGRFDEDVSTIEESRYRARATRALSHPIMELLGVGGLAATLWFAAFRIWSGTLDPADFVSFFAAVLMLYEPLKGLSRASAWLHEAAAGYDRISPLLALPPAPNGHLDAEPLRDQIRLDDVAVDRGDRRVVADVDLILPRASTTIVSGPSGAGKTSLLRVLAGLAEPSDGRVTRDGVDLTAIRRDRLARRTAYLDQHTHLFGRTVRENLTLDAPGASDEALWAALRQVDAETFVRRRGGLDAALRESGGDLSGGQRRRIALARALVSDDTDVLLLDEPTEAIDGEMERQILDTLRTIRGERTVVIVSHRPESVDWADQHVYVEPGRDGGPATVRTKTHDSEASAEHERVRPRH